MRPRHAACDERCVTRHLFRQAYRGTIDALGLRPVTRPVQLLARAAELLRATPRVVLVGEGASYGIAVVAMDILFTLGRPAVVIEDEQMGAYLLTQPAQDFTLLAISHSGETQLPTRMVREARERGINSIALTNEPASELARQANVVLSTQVVESARGRYAIAPRICQLAVLDQLFGRLAGARSSRGI